MAGSMSEYELQSIIMSILLSRLGVTAEEEDIADAYRLTEEIQKYVMEH